MTFIALIPSTYYNVMQYGPPNMNNGVVDATSYIAAAIAAASAAGGGIVFFPAGTYITTTQTLAANVSLVGAGLGATTLKLKNGTNADLLSAQTGSINLAAVLNTGSVGTLLSFSIKDLTLDGNKANQTSGTSYPLRFYGYNFILRDVQIMNGFTGGALIDWNGGSLLASPSDEMESLIDTVKIHDNNGIGLQMGGPHDSHLNDVLSWGNGSHNFHFATNAVGMLLLNCHSYFLPNVAGVCGYLVEAQGCLFTNCVAEGSYHVNVAIIALNVSWVGGSIFGTSTEWTNEIGIQLGQAAGVTPFPGQIQQAAGVTTLVTARYCRIDTVINECRGGALNCASENTNVILANIVQGAGTALVGSNISPLTDSFCLNIHGLTTDNTLGTSGGMNIATNGSNVAFTVNDQTAGQVFQIDHYGNLYVTGGFNSSAGFYFTASNTPASLATGGTISLLGLPNISVAPTTDVTGVILQAGFAGQFTIVNNSSAFTITFAASGTSHVAAGTLCKIAPNSSCIFYYNSAISLWQPTSYTVLPTQSATAAAVAASGTITTTDTNEARVSPTAAVTGVILQAGVYPGQVIYVVNESAFPITFATAATSNVADGVANIIAPLSKRDYIWDSSTSRWYSMSIAPVQSATAVVIAASGAIATAGLDVSRLAPSAARTGIIMQAGTYAGQKCFVINESANILTYNATPATSLIANSAVVTTLPATSGRLFCWDSSTSLWY